ncbi:MAG: response regulator transcription factor [Bryobacteraceae bacterium]
MFWISLCRCLGVDAARQIHKRLPRTKLLFLTVHANPAYLREALSAGATGYILKSSTREQILGAVTKALAGQTHISPGIAEGRTAKEVGAALGISHKTVAFHRNNVKRKLGVRKTVELIKRAIDEGLI